MGSCSSAVTHGSCDVSGHAFAKMSQKESESGSQKHINQREKIQRELPQALSSRTKPSSSSTRSRAE